VGRGAPGRTQLGPEGNRYVTTGRGPGTSHLHAFDRDGNLLWESPPQASPADLDSAAVASATLVDRQGDVYVSDFDQFWAFHSDGTLKWVSALPTPGQSFVSAIITKEGFVGGVTTGGEVVLFDRNDGSSAVPVFQLPAGDPPPAAPPRPGLWQGGLMDPSIIPLIEAAFFGEMMQVASTSSAARSRSPSPRRWAVAAARARRSRPTARRSMPRTATG
jgi:hypothetical protein